MGNDGGGRIERATRGETGIVAEREGENSDGGVGADDHRKTREAKRSDADHFGGDGDRIGYGEDQARQDECVFHGGNFLEV